MYVWLPDSNYILNIENEFSQIELHMQGCVPTRKGTEGNTKAGYIKT